MSVSTRHRELFAALGLVFFTACPGGDGKPDPNQPHALGRVIIGESHASTGGTASATVSASFIPDAAAIAPTCTRQIAGCELPVYPDCGGTCGEQERCTFDSSCTSVCEPSCDAACGPEQECYFPAPGSPACRQRRSFDAGSLVLSGTTTPVTLLPPYSFAGVDEGSLFIDGATITLNASGANDLGFEAFDATFTATSLLRTSPPMHQLPIADVFGHRDIPLDWIPGADEIVVSATVQGENGTLGSLTCRADDAAGTFDLPRAAIDAVLDGDTLDQLTIALRRERTETVYDLATRGEAPDLTIQPVGWLELGTTSTETASFEGCPGSESLCGESCTDTGWDPSNCGACGNDCGIEDCRNGTCSGVASCNSCVNSASTGGGSCASAYDACTNDSDCAALRTCLDACTTAACQQECASTHQAGINLYNSWVSCICNTACTDPCFDACF